MALGLIFVSAAATGSLLNGCGGSNAPADGGASTDASASDASASDASAADSGSNATHFNCGDVSCAIAEEYCRELVTPDPRGGESRFTFSCHSLVLEDGNEVIADCTPGAATSGSCGCLQAFFIPPVESCTEDAGEVTVVVVAR